MHFVMIPLEDDVWRNADKCSDDVPDRRQMLCTVVNSLGIPTDDTLPLLVVKQRSSAVVATDSTHPVLGWNNEAAVMKIKQVIPFR